MAPSALGRIGYLRVEQSPTRQVTACIHNPRLEAWPKTCLPAMLNGGRLNDTRPAVLCDWHYRQKGPLVLWRDKLCTPSPRTGVSTAQQGLFPFHPSAICSHVPGTTSRRQLQAPSQASVYMENTKNEDYKAQCFHLLRPVAPLTEHVDSYFLG